jgi:hypothetical protein
MLKGAGLAAAAGAAALVVVGKGTPAHAIVNPNLVLDQPNSATNNSTVNFTGRQVPREDGASPARAVDSVVAPGERFGRSALRRPLEPLVVLQGWHQLDPDRVAR